MVERSLPEVRIQSSAKFILNVSPNMVTSKLSHIFYLTNKSFSVYFNRFLGDIFPKKKAIGRIGPRWCSSGQRARLLLRKSEFKYHRSPQFLFCKIVWNEQKLLKKRPWMVRNENLWKNYRMLWKNVLKNNFYKTRTHQSMNNSSDYSAAASSSLWAYFTLRCGLGATKFGTRVF